MAAGCSAGDILCSPAQPPAHRLNFVQPVGVAAQGDVLLVADAGARTLWRLDRSRDAMAAFAPFSGSANGSGTSLHLGNDFSTWVALPAEHMVVQYDVRGREVRRWRDDANAPRPVAVAVPENRGELLVGDAATAQVVVFDPLGRARRLLGSGRAGALQSITAMAFGPRGLYVLDRARSAGGRARRPAARCSKSSARTSWCSRAHWRWTAAAASSSATTSTSASRYSAAPQLLATAGGAGSGPGRFGRIEAMAVDGNLLYVADSVNARVQVHAGSAAVDGTPGAPRHDQAAPLPAAWLPPRCWPAAPASRW